MATKYTKKMLITDVQTNIQKCLILKPEEKDYWLSRIDTLPVQTLLNILIIVKSKNDLLDRYVSAAIANDTQGKYSTDLKMTAKKIKQQAFQLEEKSQTQNPEEELQKMLDKI